MLFDWRNDPYIVDRSSSRRRVGRDEHGRWFRSVLSSVDHSVMIIMLGETPVGQIRFDREDENRCVVSVYLLEQHTGQGLGVEAIRKGCGRIAEEWRVRDIRACVREENSVGQITFQKAGFQAREPACCPPGHREYLLTVGSGTT